MPKRPPRKGLAPRGDSYLAYRDKVGQTFRSGKDVFALAAHGQWGETVPPGAVPVRLYRLFGWRRDKLAAYRLDASFAWCLTHPMLVALGQYVLEKIPADIIDAMAADPTLVVETNWSVTDEFETLIEDVEMRGNFSPPPPPSSFAYKHAGTLELALTPNGDLRKHQGCNYARSFRRWREQDTLSSMVPAALAGKTVTIGGPQPCTADYATAESLATTVASGGGPDLPTGERVEVGADSLVIRAVEYDAMRAEDDALAAYATGFAYIISNPYDDELTGIEMLDHERLRALATDPHTLDTLARPPGARLYLNGAHELLPGWRVVSFHRGAIRRAVVSVNPTMVEGVALLRGDADTYSFECAAREGGALVPLRRCGDRVARARLPALLHPSARAMRGLAQVWLQDVLVQKTRAAERNLDPLEFTVPCPFAYVVALPGFAAMRRSPKLRHVLTHVLSSSDDADTILGILGWHAPIGKEKNGFYLISVPELPLQVQGGATIDPRRVAGLSKHQYNFFSYDTEAQTLTLRLSVARFNASLRVRGASVGKPPAQPPPAGGRWKFSLLERAWVPSGVRAPTPRELKERYPAGPQWMHW